MDGSEISNLYRIQESEASVLMAYLRNVGPRTIKLTGQLKEEVGQIGHWWTDRWPNPKAVLCHGRGSYSFFAQDEKAAAYVLDNIDWNVEVSFSGLEYQFLPFVKQRAKDVQDNPCYLYQLQREGFCSHTFLEVEDFRIDSLCREDASQVTTYWTYGDTEDYPLARIHQAPTACIRKGGEPVSWALTHHDGSIGMVFTLQEHRRKGFAKAVISMLVKKQILAGRMPYCFIVEGNEASQRLFEELGFVEQSKVCWVHCLPK